MVHTARGLFRAVLYTSNVTSALVFYHVPVFILLTAPPGLSCCMCRGVIMIMIMHACMHAECMQRMTKLGDMFGRDRTFISTVAFG